MLQTFPFHLQSRPLSRTRCKSKLTGDHGLGYLLIHLPIFFSCAVSVRFACDEGEICRFGVQRLKEQGYVIATVSDRTPQHHCEKQQTMSICLLSLTTAKPPSLTWSYSPASYRISLVFQPLVVRVSRPFSGPLDTRPNKTWSIDVTPSRSWSR